MDLRERLQSMNLWLPVGVLLMALGWLLPNHFVPWVTFQAEAWVAVVLLCMVAVMLFKPGPRQAWSALAQLVAALCLLPLLQLALGQVKFAGIAWVGSLYLVGLLLAMLAGSRWESIQPGELAGALMLGIGFAAVASVGLQLCQWLSVTDGCLCDVRWVFFLDNYRRPSANLAQPNLLALLLIWGLPAFGWAFEQRVVRGSVATLAMAFLLFGLALTESRMGLVGVVAMALLAWYWRGLWSSRRAAGVALGLLAFYLAVFAALDHAYASGQVSSALARTTSEPRLEAWKLFIGAAWNHPWLGYGWNQTLLAQVTPTTALSNALNMRGVLFGQAHNLFLDLVLWTGLPMGLFLAAFLLRWAWRKFRRVHDGRDALVMLVLLAAGIHSMVEFPLYHTYFLLPAGLFIGVLDTRLRDGRQVSSGLAVPLAVWLVGACLLLVVVRDYLEVEESYAELRLEHNHVLSRIPRRAPEVLLLTQMRDVIVLDRLDPLAAVDSEKLTWITNVVYQYPSIGSMLRLAVALVLDGQPQAGSAWLTRLCALSSEAECAIAKKWWENKQGQNAKLARVPWPESAGRR